MQKCRALFLCKNLSGMKPGAVIQEMAAVVQEQDQRGAAGGSGPAAGDNDTQSVSFDDFLKDPGR